jgi:hypothetical protein
MEVSPVHAENIAVIRNLKSGYLSPQYHIIFDDWFETVYADKETPPPNWDDLCASWTSLKRSLARDLSHLH